MSLTSVPLLVFAVVLAVAVPVVTCGVWNRVRGPRAVRVASRLGLIGLGQAATLLVVGLVINNEFGLYASWGDLFGQDGGGPVAVRQATGVAGDLNRFGAGTSQGSAAGADRRSVLGFGGRGTSAHSPNPTATDPTDPAAPAWAGPKPTFSPGGHGTLVAAFAGPRSGVGGEGGDVTVWLPPQYRDPAYAGTRFPVVMLFPGYPGSGAGWFSVLGGGQVLASMIAQQKATPFVLVAVNVNQRGQNLNCSDIPGGPQLATYIAQDVRSMIIASFRVSDRRTGWGLMGFSDGGLCAGKLLLQYPHLFRSAAQMAGDSTPDGRQVVRAGAAFVEHNSTLWLLGHQHPGAGEPVSLLAAVSDEDADSLPVAFQLQAAAPDIVSVSEHARGAHNPAVWRRWLPEMYTWLSLHLDGAAPAA